jgi:hypothetical protein
MYGACMHCYCRYRAFHAATQRCSGAKHIMRQLGFVTAWDNSSNNSSADAAAQDSSIDDDGALQVASTSKSILCLSLCEDGSFKVRVSQPQI